MNKAQSFNTTVVTTFKQFYCKELDNFTNHFIFHFRVIIFSLRQPWWKRSPDVFSERGQGPADIEERERHWDNIDLLHTGRAGARNIRLE